MTTSAEPRRAVGIDLRAATILVVCCAIWGLGLVMVKASNADTQRSVTRRRTTSTTVTPSPQRQHKENHQIRCPKSAQQVTWGNSALLSVTCQTRVAACSP